MDTSQPGGPHGEPGSPLCHSCRNPITPGQAIERIRFDSNQHGLEDMNGTYHSECAQPILTVKRAYDALSGFPF